MEPNHTTAKRLGPLYIIQCSLPLVLLLSKKTRHRGCNSGCRVDVSPTDVSPAENSWMLRPLNKASLGYYAPDRCVPDPWTASHIDPRQLSACPLGTDESDPT
jgi:hypothetical protein